MEHSAKESELSPQERSAILRGLIEQENDVRDQVFSWFLALNGFLFTALGFAWNDADGVVYVLGALGSVGALSWTAQTTVSRLAINRLRQVAADDDADELPIVGMTSSLLREFGPPYNWLPLLYPWRILPPLLGLAWVAVIVVRIFT